MRKPVKEIENVLQRHDYSINTIIVEVMNHSRLVSFVFLTVTKSDANTKFESADEKSIGEPTTLNKRHCFVRMSRGFQESAWNGD